MPDSPRLRSTVALPLAVGVVLAVTLRADDVRLDFPEVVELKVVVDYVAASLRINILYSDEALAGKRVALRVNQAVPRESLLPLLRSVLRSRGLALVESDQPGWLRIVPVEQLAAESGPLRTDPLPPGTGEALVVTQAIAVQHGDLEKIKAAITPYLSKPGGSILVLTEGRRLVVTDFARNVQRVAEIVALLDVPAAATAVETIPVRHQDAAELAALIGKLLAERGRLEGAVATPLTLQPQPLAGGIVAIGPPPLVQQARVLVERFDVPGPPRRTELYQPRFITASRLKTLAEQTLAGALLKLLADDASNTLIATGPEADQQRLKALAERFDTAPSLTATPMRFYKLLNRRVDDVFATLGGLLGVPVTQSEPNAPNGAAGPGPAGTPPPGQTDRSGVATMVPGAPPPPLGTSSVPPPVYGEPNSRPAGRGGRVAAIQGANFSISVDEHTNSIIAIATPELHQQIEQLIRQLDKRRPQVLVEVTLVSVTVDDSMDLGVELQVQELGGSWGYELFTSFGLSAINPTNGTRRLNVQAGGTGVLLGPDEVPIILHALQTRGNTKVCSAPRILVDDNATGRIESVAESPFSSVNASTTVATTSFAGFAKAGTQLSIEPHIAQGDHLELNYTLTVSTFTGTATATTPPPRSSDTINSTIRVPDGFTAVVGGLQTETVGETATQVPLLGDLPIVGYLFGVNTTSRSNVRLYAFIRPTILRSETFEDLKYLSTQDAKAAHVDDGFPPTHLQYMRAAPP